jgi:hypothetical protein
VLAPIPLVTYAFTDEVRDHIRSYLRMENGAQVAALANTPLTSLEVLRPFYAQPGPLALVATRPRYPLYPDQHSRIYPKRCGTQSIGPHHARRGGEIVLANPGVTRSALLCRLKTHLGHSITHGAAGDHPAHTA